MRPTPPDATPRRDKWHEHDATWGEVTIGTVLANRQRRTERWEIIDMAHGAQVGELSTLWMRAREQTTGEEFTISPRAKSNPVIILTQEPDDTQPLEPTPPSDSDALALLVEKLGATEIATRDERTGEITCPQFEYDVEEMLRHLEIAHGIDAATLRDLPGDERARQIYEIHGQSHSPRYEVGKGGFPHRHVPEDHTLATGIRR